MGVREAVFDLAVVRHRDRAVDRGEAELGYLHLVVQPGPLQAAAGQGPPQQAQGRPAVSRLQNPDVEQAVVEPEASGGEKTRRLIDRVPDQEQGDVENLPSTSMRTFASLRITRKIAVAVARGRLMRCRRRSRIRTKCG